MTIIYLVTSVVGSFIYLVLINALYFLKIVNSNVFNIFMSVSDFILFILIIYFVKRINLSDENRNLIERIAYVVEKIIAVLAMISIVYYEKNLFGWLSHHYDKLAWILITIYLLAVAFQVGLKFSSKKNK